MIPRVSLEVDWNSEAFTAIQRLIFAPMDKFTAMATGFAAQSIRMKYGSRFLGGYKLSEGQMDKLMRGQEVVHPTTQVSERSLYTKVKESVVGTSSIGFFTGSTLRSIQSRMSGKEGMVVMEGRWPEGGKTLDRQIPTDQVFYDTKHHESYLDAVERIMKPGKSQSEQSEERAKRREMGIPDTRGGGGGNLRFRIKRVGGGIAIMWPAELLKQLSWLSNVYFPSQAFQQKVYGKDYFALDDTYDIAPASMPAPWLSQYEVPSRLLSGKAWQKTVRMGLRAIKEAEKKRQQKLKAWGLGADRFKPIEKDQDVIKRNRRRVPIEFFYLDDEDVRNIEKLIAGAIETIWGLEKAERSKPSWAEDYGAGAKTAREAAAIWQSGFGAEKQKVKPLTLSELVARREKVFQGLSSLIQARKWTEQQHAKIFGTQWAESMALPKVKGRGLMPATTIYEYTTLFIHNVGLDMIGKRMDQVENAERAAKEAAKWDAWAKDFATRTKQFYKEQGYGGTFLVQGFKTRKEAAEVVAAMEAMERGRRQTRRLMDVKTEAEELEDTMRAIDYSYMIGRKSPDPRKSLATASMTVDENAVRDFVNKQRDFLHDQAIASQKQAVAAMKRKAVEELASREQVKWSGAPGTPGMQMFSYPFSMMFGSSEMKDFEWYMLMNMVLKSGMPLY